MSIKVQWWYSVNNLWKVSYLSSSAMIIRALHHVLLVEMFANSMYTVLTTSTGTNDSLIHMYTVFKCTYTVVCIWELFMYMYSYVGIVNTPKNVLFMWNHHRDNFTLKPVLSIRGCVGILINFFRIRLSSGWPWYQQSRVVEVFSFL